MPTNDKSNQPEQPVPRKKGGGDGKAKDAVAKTKPSEQRDEMSSSEGASGSGAKSRKITTSRR